MKFCVLCEHFTPSNWCASPENGLSLVDAKPKVMFASERRSVGESLLFPDSIKCGPEGVNFQPKEVVPDIPWWKFWLGTTRYPF